jgi:hypothetical protein
MINLLRRNNSIPGLSALLWRFRYPQAGQVCNTGVIQLTVTKISKSGCSCNLPSSDPERPLSKCPWRLAFSMSIKGMKDSAYYSLFL